VPRGDPVHGIGVVRDLDTTPDQLIAKSYRPRSGSQRGVGECGDALNKVRRGQGQWFPKTLPSGRVERREHLAAASVQQGEGGSLTASLANPMSKGIERACAGHRQVQAGAECPRGGEADPQPGERPGTQANRDPVDPLPAPGGRGGLLHLVEQSRGMPRPPSGHGTKLRLEQDLAAAHGADGGVVGRRVEADYDQFELAASR
jgi:hypothetical protein